jgi:hypothetical protein
MKQDLLLYGKEYHLWREGEYLGIATYTDDPNIGDSFLRAVIDKDNEVVNEVYIPDEWQFI